MFPADAFCMERDFCSFQNLFEQDSVDVVTLFFGFVVDTSLLLDKVSFSVAQ